MELLLVDIRKIARIIAGILSRAKQKVTNECVK